MTNPKTHIASTATAAHFARLKSHNPFIGVARGVVT